MTLPHFLTDAPLAPDEEGRLALSLTRELAEHLRSARIRPGEHIVLADGQGKGLEIEVEAVFGERLEGRVVRRLIDRVGEQLTLVQGISRSDRMDQIVRQATELGLVRIIPFKAERTTVRLDEAQRNAKQERWKRVARAATEQSTRLTAPLIDAPVDLAGALALTDDFDGRILAWEEAGDTAMPLGLLVRGMATAVFANPRIALFIGPEGGFAPAELVQMREAGVQLASLGPTILRTETAALVAAAIVLYHLGGLGA
ncbi:MAG: 16S rRNA (uracil(1498)-N(3))-methyltransferase [Coriobacteriales bacterium]|nr:16S rRNA (uracil(1498)-N(3))-methyltransferase [Coriobacteriales bacterium]